MFSNNERRVLKILGRRKMSIREITYKFYCELPINGNNYIAQVLRRIKAKCKFNKLKWTIDGKGAGRNGKTVWRKRL